MQNFYQLRTQPILNGFCWNYITCYNSAVSPPFEVKFFWWLFIWRGSNFSKISIFWGPWGKLKSIFEIAENLSLVLTKLDTELGLAQPQLVQLNSQSKHLASITILPDYTFLPEQILSLRGPLYSVWPHRIADDKVRYHPQKPQKQNRPRGKCIRPPFPSFCKVYEVENESEKTIWSHQHFL